MENSELIKVDIDKVLKAKAPNRKVPRFLVNYLKKIAHEEELNAFFEKNIGKRNTDFIDAALEHLQATVTIEGMENLPPANGKYIFVSNHPLGGLDGLTTGSMLAKAYNNKIRFFSNDILTHLHPLREMFIPVNKVGSQSKDHAEMMQQLYESENHLLTYPAGMCSRKVNGKIVDPEWKKNFISKAIQYQRNVVPIYFEGRNSNFFYNLARLRKFLKIKINIEMLYLADEMFKQRGKHFTIRIGKPIPWQSFNKSKSQAEWAYWVKEIVYKMKK